MVNFLDLSEISKNKLRKILDSAKKMKFLRKGSKNGIVDKKRHLDGHVVGLIFEKPSTRTRVSFDVGVRQMGGQSIFLSASDLQLTNGENASDTAKVLSRYLDMVMIRTFEEKTILDFAASSSIPVINGLTNRSHPCQVMADIMTFEEARGNIAGKKVVWIGDGNNVCLSYMHAAMQFGFNLIISSPTKFLPLKENFAFVTEHGADVKILSDPFEAVENADLIITDTYFSMHNKDAEADEKLNLFRNYQVNQSLIARAKSNVVFLHCLPAHREIETTSDVIDGKNSMVFEAAENRLHVQKAIMKWCISH